MSGGELRHPRAVVVVNGKNVIGWDSWQVESNANYQADTARVVFAVSALEKGYSADWFAKQKTIEVEIRAGFPKDLQQYTDQELPLIFSGVVDNLDYDPMEAEIEINCRDHSASIIDSKITEKFQNQSVADIVRTIAQRHGLTAVVIGGGTKAGTFYEIDHAKLNSQRTEWDLLTYLAQQTGSRVFMRGKELHFESSEGKGSAYPIKWQKPTAENNHASSSAKRLVLSRSLTIAKDVIVKVRSWHSKHAKTYYATAQRTSNDKTVTVTAGAGNSKTGDAQVYEVTIPGLTQEQALQKAQEIRRSVSSHEMRLEAELPADNVLSLQSIIELSGTGTAFDQAYYPFSIMRTMSAQEGYTMSFSAKNHSPETEVII